MQLCDIMGLLIPLIFLMGGAIMKTEQLLRVIFLPCRCEVTVGVLLVEGRNTVMLVSSKYGI